MRSESLQKRMLSCSIVMSWPDNNSVLGGKFLCSHILGIFDSSSFNTILFIRYINLVLSACDSGAVGPFTFSRELCFENI